MTISTSEREPDWNIEATDALLDNWPIRDVLVALTHAATHLLTDHDCDAHGYEQLQHAVVAARRHADLLDSKAASRNLTEHDKTRFPERGFTVVENAGRSLRLIKRDDTRQAISIRWNDLPALRELITLALDDGPMVIGLDTSGETAKKAATSMRDLCVTRLNGLLAEYEAEQRTLTEEDTEYTHRIVRQAILSTRRAIAVIQSLTLEEQKTK